MLNAVLSTNFGSLVYYLHKSSASSLKLANALSSTRPAMLGSRSACISAVIAPILLPDDRCEMIKLFVREISFSESYIYSDEQWINV